jgi:hypothetical protein
VTDGTGVAAPAISQQVGPPCDGVVGTEKLPVVEGRTAAFEILRSAGSVDRDTRGGYLITWVGAGSLALRHPELFSLRCAFDSLGSSFPIIPVPACPRSHQTLSVARAIIRRAAHQCPAGLAVWAQWHRQLRLTFPAEVWAAR